MNDASKAELVHCADQIGAHLKSRLDRAGVDARSVAWSARQQLDLALSMFCDHAPDAPLDPEDTAAVAMTAWWALVVGTGLGDQDLVAYARTVWED